MSDHSYEDEVPTDEAVQEEQIVEDQADTTDDSATSDDDQPQQGDEGGQPKPRGAGKRIAELIEQREHERRDKEYWRELALRAQQQTPVEKPAEQQAPPAPAELRIPTLEEHGYDETAYAAAMARYQEQLLDAKLAEREQQLAAARQQEALAQEQAKLQAAHQLREQAFVQQHPDYQDRVYDPTLPVTEAMADAIRTSEIGPEVAYHLANNRAEAQRIASLNPVAQVREIGRIEASLARPSQQRVSSAPPPVEPVSGGGERSTKDPDQMSVDEWLEWRRRQLEG